MIIDNKSFFIQLSLVHFVTDGCKRHIHLDLSHSRSAQVDIKSLLLLSSDAFWKGRGVGQLQAHVRGPYQRLQQRRPRGRLTTRVSSHSHSKQIIDYLKSLEPPSLDWLNSIEKPLILRWPVHAYHVHNDLTMNFVYT